MSTLSLQGTSNPAHDSWAYLTEVLFSDDNEDDLWESFNPDVLAAWEEKNGEVTIRDTYYVDHWDSYVDTEGVSQEEAEKLKEAWITKLKWKEIRDAVFPEPRDFEPVTYSVAQSLRDRFKDTGLQVIVKMASIELTPEKSEFPVGGWHVSIRLHRNYLLIPKYLAEADCAPD